MSDYNRYAKEETELDENPFWWDLLENGEEETTWREMSFHRFEEADSWNDLQSTDWEEFLLEG